MLNFRNELREQASDLFVQTLKSGLLGDVLTWTARGLTAIPLYVAPGPVRQVPVLVDNVTIEEQRRTFYVPAQPGLLARIVTKALASNVATLTTRRAHGFVAGQLVIVEFDAADTTFDGRLIAASVPASTSLTYAKTAGDVASAAARGWLRGEIQSGDKFTYGQADWEVLTSEDPAGVGAAFEVETRFSQPVSIGAA